MKRALARTLRRIATFALLFAAVVAASVVLAPRERTPVTGAWLRRARLEPHRVHVGDFDLRYVRTGSGPTLLLIHGLASSLYSWADVIEPLSRDFDVIAFDLPGFGESTQPPDLQFEALPSATIGLLDALGVERAHLAGNSLGGATAALVAARFPSRILRLALIDSAGFNLAPSARPFMVRVLGSEAAGFFAERLPIRRLLTRVTLRRVIQNDARVTEERVDEYVAPLLRAGALASARSLIATRAVADFGTEVRKVAAPTLVIWGRFDPWVDPSQADLFLKAIPGSRKVLLDVGHMPQEERPEEVVRLLREHFLDSPASVSP